MSVLDHLREHLSCSAVLGAGYLRYLLRTQWLIGVRQHPTDGLASLAQAVLFSVADYGPRRGVGVELQGKLCWVLDIPAINVEEGVSLASPPSGP